jgi:hypothetical protein
MNRTALGSLGIIQLFLAASAHLLFAQPNSATDGVICRTNRSLLQRGGELTLLLDEMTMPGGITVLSNGTFRVNEGKPRLLREGQILREDGFLLNPDGSTMPVCDHIAMSGAAVLIFKDGDSEPLTAPLTLPDGSIINPDGTYARPYGRTSRLVDGQLLTIDGASLPGLDTISLRNDKLVVYKVGAVIPLQSPTVIMGMYDGTRVRGDGFITFHNGTTMQMTEGQIITVPGVRANW